jgi:hypothetical protein
MDESKKGRTDEKELMVYWKINGYKEKKVIWRAGNKE